MINRQSPLNKGKQFLFSADSIEEAEHELKEGVEVVISTRDLPRDKMIEAQVFSWFQNTFHINGITNYISRVLYNQGIEYRDFYDKLYETFPKFDDTWVTSSVFTKSQLLKYWRHHGINEVVSDQITVTAGNSEGFGYWLTQSTFPCAYSSACGSCTSSISGITLTSAPANVPGGCSAPPPTPPPTPFTLYAPTGFSPNGDGINDTFKIYTYLNGVYSELNYAAYPNATLL